MPVREVYAEAGAMAGPAALTEKAAEHRQKGEYVHALHLLELALAADPANTMALSEQKRNLELLLMAAKVLNNTYEVMWLEHQIAQTCLDFVGASL